jgi:predicted O-linked N-acetylglucosamine transferase (SPINDLY family)
LVQKFNIDIAIDLMGHSGGDFNRFGIFVNRVAPIQICFMGFPCTTGSETIDYLVADKLIIPEKFQKFYSEKIIYLPDTYQPNEELKEACFQFKSKKDLDLPDNKFIFCCFNGHQKIQPKIFNLWMKILDKRKDSVLWLLRDNENSEQNLKKNASKLGIDPNRLIFAKKIQIDKHLARLKFADLFLDTYPYGAHTTCSNALRMNLPVITMKGESFASRVSASILNSINCNELIVDNIEDYEKLALKISNESESLRKIREKIKKQIELSNLFKPKIFTKNLERGYLKVYQNYIDGSKPKTIEL